MRKRKWLASILLAMVVTMSLNIPVFADEPVTIDASNSTIRRTFAGYTSGFNTNLRRKDDDSYHYINNTSGFYLGVVSKASDDSNCTRNGRAVVTVGEYFITNYVKENGKNYCRLYITAAYSGTSGYVTGEWSPDSVGSYPIVN